LGLSYVLRNLLLRLPSLAPLISCLTFGVLCSWTSVANGSELEEDEDAELPPDRME
jgi:hypothetical protein